MILMLGGALKLSSSILRFQRVNYTTGLTMLHAVVIDNPFGMNDGIDRCLDKLRFTRLHDFSSLVSQRRDGGKFRPTACFTDLNALAGPSMQRRLI